MSNITNASFPRIIDFFEDHYATDTNIYFGTFTLPKRMYRMRATRQFIASKKVVRNVMTNYFDNAIIVAELTQAANIHWHFIGKIKVDHDKGPYHMTQEAILKCLKDNMKEYARFDIQKVKHPIECLNYLLKDISTTHCVIEKQPWFLYDVDRSLENYTPDMIMDAEYKYDLDFYT